ncbi:MAG TPA: hypothetical protein VKF40_05985, partial [Burkholderiales bacterium]|nr:hypothetical protein [Burkholderiales bacterium]
RSAAQHAVELRFEGAATVEEIEPAVSRLDKQGVQALVVLSTALFSAEAARIAKLAVDRHWPLVGTGTPMHQVRGVGRLRRRCQMDIWARCPLR